MYSPTSFVGRLRPPSRKDGLTTAANGQHHGTEPILHLVKNGRKWCCHSSNSMLLSAVVSHPDRRVQKTATRFWPISRRGELTRIRQIVCIQPLKLSAKHITAIEPRLRFQLSFTQLSRFSQGHVDHNAMTGSSKLVRKI